MFLLLFLIFFSVSSSSFSSTSSSSVKRKYIAQIEAHVTHGTNNFNGELIADPSEYTNYVFVTTPGIYEIGAYNENGESEDPITKYTDLSRLVSTTSSLHDFARIPLIDKHLVNIPINEVGTLFLASRNVNDRVPITSFEDVSRRGEVYGKRNRKTDITIGDWNKASGILTITKSKKTGLYELEVEMCGFKNSIYNVWESSVRYAKTDKEIGFITPGGGLPNTIITNENGYGKIKWSQKWNPLECNIGNDCTTNYSIGYSFDSSSYGGAPVLGGQGMAAGILAANHLWIPTIGNILQKPTNKFRSKHCKY